jgi:beta-lactamase class A
MHRRTLAFLTASALAGSIRPGIVRASDGSGSDTMQDGGGDLAAALQSFHALPGTKSYLIRAGQGGSLGHVAHQPRRFMFTASAYKTFVLGQYLREVEAGLLSEDEQLAIDDSVRMLGSPVLLGLTGATTAQSVLEAMIRTATTPPPTSQHIRQAPIRFAR